MATIRDQIKEASCHELQGTVETASGRFLCFTRVDGDGLVLGASDGCDVWRVELDATELEANSDLAGTNLDTFLARIRSGFKAGAISLIETGKRMTVTLGRGNQAIDFDLFEAKAAEKRVELQHILFRLSDKVLDLEGKLEKAAQTIEGLQQQKGAGPSGASGLVDLGGDGKKKGPARAAPKQAGMSVINPGSRKRKAPRGVQFD